MATSTGDEVRDSARTDDLASAPATRLPKVSGECSDWGWVGLASDRELAGYRLKEKLGGGGFSWCVEARERGVGSRTSLTGPPRSVYRAYDEREGRTAACKVMVVDRWFSQRRRRMADNEIRVHSVLGHRNIVQFYGAVRVNWEQDGGSSGCQEGIYVLMELAEGGNLFDKIGGWGPSPRKGSVADLFLAVSGVGVDDDAARHYFGQLLDGLVRVPSRVDAASAHPSSTGAHARQGDLPQGPQA